MSEVFAEIISIGDEILYGQTLDTNSHWISGELDKIGIRVKRKITIGDKENEILEALADAEARASLILITGGLGPTSDDLTKPCLVKYFNTRLILDTTALNDVTEFFARRGKELTELNHDQALVPEICTVIRNSNGTAPGMWFDKAGKVFVSMPGVPHEMKNMMLETVIPKIAERFKVPELVHRIIKTSGIGESFLADVIKDWEASLPAHIKLAYLPSPGEVKLRLTALGDDRDLLYADLDKYVNLLQPLAGNYIFGYGNDTLEQVIGKFLLDKNKKLAVAESCSGGYLAHTITRVPGASGWFNGGVVAYSNQSKVDLLDVSLDLIEQEGAVSEAVVKGMAEHVRIKFNADIGLAISGIAGPEGGTLEKPVGTVWIACAFDNHTFCKKMQLSIDRNINIKLSSIYVLNELRHHLIKMI
ncbi:MAG: competence/damage-inducible protein A [Cyclobacteriaceae bacterium]